MGEKQRGKRKEKMILSSISFSEVEKMMRKKNDRKERKRKNE